MSEEAKSQEGDLSPAEKESADIRANEVEENKGLAFEPLFDEAISEAELQGEEASTEEKEAEPKKPDEKKDEKSEKKEGLKKDEAKPADSEPKDAKKPEEKAEEKTDDKKEEAAPEDKSKEEPKSEEVDYSKPPPKGYVPLPALKEERAKRETLNTKISELERQNNALALQLQNSQKTTPVEEDGFKDFKLLSPAEFDELVEEEGTEAAAKYQFRAQRYQEFQNKKVQQQQFLLDHQRKIENVVSESFDTIKEAVPGVYDPETQVADKLAEFAEKNGFDPTFLLYMSDPRTRIIPVDDEGKPTGQQYPLSKGAVSLVKFINKIYTASKDNDPETLRSKIEAELEPKIREKITNELVEKFKKETTGATFKSITDAPGGDDSEPSSTKFISEADYAKMSPEEKERVLAGA